jgi:hypothetical protein
LIVQDDNGHSLACAIVAVIGANDRYRIDSLTAVPCALCAQAQVMSIEYLPVSRRPFIACYIGKPENWPLQ